MNHSTIHLQAALAITGRGHYKTAEIALRKAISAAMREGNRPLAGKCLRALHCVRHAATALQVAA